MYRFNHSIPFLSKVHILILFTACFAQSKEHVVALKFSTNEKVIKYIKMNRPNAIYLFNHNTNPIQLTITQLTIAYFFFLITFIY